MDDNEWFYFLYISLNNKTTSVLSLSLLFLPMKPPKALQIWIKVALYCQSRVVLDISFPLIVTRDKKYLYTMGMDLSAYPGLSVPVLIYNFSIALPYEPHMPPISHAHYSYYCYYTTL